MNCNVEVEDSDTMQNGNFGLEPSVQLVESARGGGQWTSEETDVPGVVLLRAERDRESSD